MNKRQINKLGMYRATRALLANAPETTPLTAFPPVFAAFTEKLGAIETLIATQATPVAATIAHREAVLAEMVEAVVALSGIGSSYASRQKLPDLTVKMRVRPADFVRLRLDQRVHRALAIVDALRPLVPQLADYGLTSETFEAVEAKIASAERVSPSARQTVAQKRAATTELADACHEIDRILEDEMDAVLRPLQRANRQFYENYLAVREVVDRPGGRPAAQDETVAPAAPQPERQAA